MTSKEFLSRWAIFGEHEPVETIEAILQDKKMNAECIPGCRMLSKEECKIWQVESVDSDEEIDEQWLETIEAILQDKKMNAECIPGCRMLSKEECKIWQVESVDSDEEIDEQWLETITREDTVVCVLGEHESQSGEAASRAFLTLPEEQQMLFEKIATVGSAENLRKVQSRHHGMETGNHGSGSDHRSCVWHNQSFGKTGCKYSMVCGTGADKLLGYKNRTCTYCG